MKCLEVDLLYYKDSLKIPILFSFIISSSRFQLQDVPYFSSSMIAGAISDFFRGRGNIWIKLLLCFKTRLSLKKCPKDEIKGRRKGARPGGEYQTLGGERGKSGALLSASHNLWRFSSSKLVSHTFRLFDDLIFGREYTKYSLGPSYRILCRQDKKSKPYPVIYACGAGEQPILMVEFCSNVTAFYKIFHYSA